MNDILSAILLGIIEGITEFLPISSTGHLLIAERWLGARSDLFNIAIQAGAILAVCLLYRQRLWQLASGLGDPEQRRYAAKLLLAFAITAVLGLAVSKAGFKLPTEITPIAWALVIGGIWILLAERLVANKCRSSPAYFRARRGQPQRSSSPCSPARPAGPPPPSSRSSSAFRRCSPRPAMSC